MTRSEVLARGLHLPVGLVNASNRLKAPHKSLAIMYFCGLYVAAAMVLIPDTYISVFSQYPIQRYFFLVPVLIILGLLVGAAIQRPWSPLTFIRDKLVSRGLGATAIIITLILTATAFTAFKHEYSKWMPFFADAFLADLDWYPFFEDPWRVARAVFPASLDWPLYVLYARFWFVEILATVLVAAFLENQRARVRYLAAFATSTIFLSSIVRMIGSSSGPIFYDRMFGGNRFADLTEVLRNSDAGPNALKVSDYLYTSFATDTSVLGTGISAMPSLHVALAVLNAIFISSLNRWAGAAAWFYATAIGFGSVYFGWHYAWDGYVSIAAVVIIWRLASAWTEDLEANPVQSR